MWKDIETALGIAIFVMIIAVISIKTVRVIDVHLTEMIAQEINLQRK